MTSILSLIETVFSNIFRWNYLGKKRFAQIFFAFYKFSFIFEQFQKKDKPNSWSIFELTGSEKRD